MDTQIVNAIKCTSCGVTYPRPDTSGAVRPPRLKSDGTPAIPKGWYVSAGEALCRACRRGAWVIRAVSFPVRTPEGVDAETFIAELRMAWRCASELSTLTERLLYAADDGWDAEKKKLAAPPKVSDTTIRAMLPGYFPSAAATQMKTMVTTRYAKRRIGIHRNRDDTPSVYKDPSPMAVRYDRVALREGKDGRLYAAFPWVTGERVEFELLNGKEFARPCAAIRRVLAGEARLRLVMLIPQMCRRESGGTVKVGYRRASRARNDVYRPMLKLVIEERRAARGEQTGTATLATGRWPLLTMTGDGLPSNGFVWHGADLARVIRMRERRQQQLREDRKAVTGAARHACSEKMGDAALKDNRRMTSGVQRLVAQVADKARRINIQTLRWKNTDKSFAESFPWTMFEAALKHALNKINVALVEVEDEACA